MKAGVDEVVLVLVERRDEPATLPGPTVELKAVRAAPATDRELQVLALGRRRHVVYRLGYDIDDNLVERVGAMVVRIGNCRDDPHGAVVVAHFVVLAILDLLQEAIGLFDDVHFGRGHLVTPALSKKHGFLPD